MKVKFGIEEVKRAQAYKSLYHFIQYFWHVLEKKDFQGNWHLECICDHLEAVSNGRIRRLLINIPPRHTKSLSVSVFWPAWEWLRSPHTQFLASSYGQNLSTRDSIKCRRILDSPEYREMFRSFNGHEFVLEGDQNTKTRYENSDGGQRLATSVGGALTGEGGDILCVAGDTVLCTDQGLMAIQGIVDGAVACSVRSWNSQDGKFEMKPVVGWFDNGTAEVFEIETEDGKFLKCTRTHEVLTKRGYVEAQDLRLGDSLSLGFETGEFTAPKSFIGVGTERVFDVEIQDNHNYVANGLVVHNCIDDAHNVTQAESPAEQQNVIDWWDEAMSTRLNDPKTGAYVIIMQRVHEGDLIGHILDKEGEEWDKVIIPGLYEGENRIDTCLDWADPRTSEGEVLWESRFGEKEMNRLMKTLGTYGAAAQIQQRPAPREGGLLQSHWFVKISEMGLPAKVDKRLRFWDLAATKKLANKDPDYTVGALLSMKKGVLFIEDMVRVRTTPMQVRSLVRSCAERDPEGTLIFMEQEGGSSGVNTIDTYAREVLAGYPFRGIPSSGNKESYALGLAAAMEAGNVRVVFADWNDAFFKECDLFPTAKHDDTVDAVSKGLAQMRNTKRAGVMRGSK